MPMVSPPDAGVITNTTYPAPAGGGVSTATTWFERLRNFAAQLAGGAAEQTLTIASGTVTPTQAVHAIETENGDAADDLALIGQSNVPAGWEVRIRCADASHVVTVKHNAGGTGSINLADGQDLALNDITMWLDLQRRGTAWYEVRRSYGGNKAGLTAFLNAATAAVKGIVELATGTETITGSDANRAVTPDSLAALWEDGGDLSNGATITLPEGGSFNLVTSTTAITTIAFSTSKAGRRAVLRFATARTLTQGSNLLLPTGANIATAAGDICEVEDRGGGITRVNWYQRADGTPLTTPISIPTGTVLQTAVTAAPAGFLLCYGQAVSRTTYADLFSAIGTGYGAGDGSTTFNVPDLRGRVVAGKDDMGGSAASRLAVTISGTTTNGSTSVTGLSSTAALAVGMKVIGTGIPAGATIAAITSGSALTLSANATASGTVSLRFGVVDGATLGAAGGSQAHTLITAQMPAHTHSVHGQSNVGVAGTPVSQFPSAGNNQLTGSTGGDQAHPNVQPTIVLNFIIKT